MAKRNLTAKQRLFVAHYLDTLNAKEAAKRAGYKGNDATLRSVGSENLTKPNILEPIEEGLKKLAMPQDEILARATGVARGELPARQLRGWNKSDHYFEQLKGLEFLAKVYGMLRERLELEGEIIVKGYSQVSPDDWDEDVENKK